MALSTPLDPHAGVLGAPPLPSGRNPHAGVEGAPPLPDGRNPHAGVEGAPPLGIGTNPHAGVIGAPPLGTAGDEHPTKPHGPAGTTEDSVVVGSVSKAEGALGRTVSEVYAQRAELNGKRVRVRAVVVKSMSGILGRTFAHLRDGSGSAGSGDHDLTITTSAGMELGQQVLLEGNVITDKDVGAGYSYPVLLEDAQLLDTAVGSL